MAKINKWFLYAGGMLGNITDHPTLVDSQGGALSLTSPVVGKSKGRAVTASGTHYRLGELHSPLTVAEFNAWWDKLEEISDV
jgi:hypothetical protein